MATFIRWSETSSGSNDQFLVSMFSTLSSRYYPVNIIGSGLYDIFSMYASEFVDAYDEIQQTYDDISIDTVRTTPITGRNFSKMYDNFGALLNSSKRYDQFYDRYSSGSMVQGYRQQLRFLTQAFLNGMSITGFERLGQAFTGVSPIIEEHIKANPRWILKSYSGSVLTVGQGFIISDVYIPRIGNVIPLENSSIFSPGDNFVMSFSHLGANTKLSGRDLYYNSIIATYYTDNLHPTTQSVTTLQNTIDFQALRVVRADLMIRPYYSRLFSYYRPSDAYDTSSSFLTDVPTSGIGIPAWLSGTQQTLSDDFAIHEKGFLYNVGRLHGSGSIHDTPVLDLGAKCTEYRWFYDWMVNTREYGRYEVEVRQYPSASIPDSLYYIPIVTTDKALPEILPEDTGSIRAHWFNVRSASIYDATGGALLSSTSVPSYTPILSRDPRRYCFLYSGSIAFNNTSNTVLNFNKSISMQMWLLRLSSTTTKASSAFEIKRQQGSSYYKFYINSNNSTLHFAIADTFTFADVSASISPYMNLESPYPHYFAVSYISGSVLFFVDGTTIGTASIASPNRIPDMPAATQSIDINIPNIGIDEILLSDDYVDDIIAYDNFMNTRPRYTGVGIPSSSIMRYQQARFTFYGYNTRDIELHQFSVRGAPSESIAKYLNPYYNYPYILPVFKKL